MQMREKVAEAIAHVGMPLSEKDSLRRADAAIAAVLNHLKDNVSDGMVNAGMDAIDSPFFADLEKAFRAMIAQARREQEDGK